VRICEQVKEKGRATGSMKTVQKAKMIDHRVSTKRSILVTESVPTRILNPDVHVYN
jgi:hypothetical protein